MRISQQAISYLRKLNNKCINFSTSEIVRVIDVGVQGVSGVTVGGIDGKTLYVIAGSAVLNVLTGEVTGEVIDGTSIYTITGLNLTGRKSSGLCLESEIKPIKTSLDKC